MAIFRDIKFNTGTCNDRLGAVGTVTGSTFSQKEKGLAIETGASKYIQYDKPLLPSGSFSVVCWARIKNNANDTERAPVMGNITDGTECSLSIWFPAAVKAMMWMGSSYYRYFNFTFDKKWHCIIFTINGTDINTAQMFSDSVSLSVSSTVSTGSPTTRTGWNIVGGSGGATNGGLNISRLKVYDHVLSLQEINAEQVEFNNAQPINKPKKGFVLNKPTDLSSQVNNTLGADVIINGSFDTNTSWNKGTGWSISNGKASKTSGVGASLNQTGITVAGKRYRITFTVSDYVSGAIVNDGNATPIDRVANGTYVEEYVNRTGFTGVGLWGNASFVGSVDNVIVQEVTGLIAAYNMQPVGNTLVDISGNGNNGAKIGQLVFNKKGIVGTRNTTGYYSSTPKTIDLNSNFSLNFRVKINTLTEYANIMTQTNTPTSFVWVYFETGGYLLLDQNSGGKCSVVAANYIGEESTFTINFVSATNTTTFYKNGIQLGVPLTTYNPVGARSGVITIGAYPNDTTWNCKNEIQDLRIYNRVLTLQEIKDYNNSFIQPTLLEDFSDAGADNQASVPREWAKTSGSFKVVENVIKQGELVVNGDFSSAAGWTLQTGATISGGVGILTNTSANTGFYQSGICTLGKAYKVKFDIVSISSGSVGVWCGGTTSTPIPYSAVGTYVVTLFAIQGTNGNFLIGSTINGTNASIDNVSVTEIQPLQTITNGTKYLEAITAGVVATPSNTAYGSWEMDFYKGGVVDSFGTSIISSTSKAVNNAEMNGYDFGVNSSLQYRLNKRAAGVDSNLQLANSLITANTWYRIKITRTTTGLFTVLIKGGSFAPTAGYDGWTLVSLTSGTNPVTDNTYTTSNYFVMSLGAGDRVTNIKITNGLSSVSIPPTWLYGDNVLSQFWGDNLGLELWGDNL